MTKALLELAAIVLTFGACAFARPRARPQPRPGWGESGAAEKILAGAAVLVAGRTATLAVGLGEAVLVIVAALSVGASLFVPLASVRPRWAWWAAWTAPVVWLVLVLAARRTGS